MAFRDIFRRVTSAPPNHPVKEEESDVELTAHKATKDETTTNDSPEITKSENPGLTAFRNGEIELDATLDDVRADRYYIATRVDSLSNLKLVIGGHSNSGGPIFSLVDPKFQGSEYANQTIAFGFGGLLGASEYPIYWEIFSRLGIDKSLALVWNGSEPYVDFMLNIGVSFDYLPRGYYSSSVDESLELVPESVIIETFWPSLGSLVEFMKANPPTDHLKRFLVGTPPPIYSSEEITKRLAKEPFFAQRAKDFGLNINNLSVTRPELRHKLWFTLQTVLQELADQAGWHFIAVPDDCFDELGYLKLELSVGDCVHANADFGKRVNREIFNAILGA